MRLRPFAPDDADGVRTILDAVYADDQWVRSLHEGSHGLPIDRPTFRRSSLVAELETSTASALLVDDELVSWHRIRERNIAEEITLAEEFDALALVVLGVGGSLGPARHRPACSSCRPSPIRRPT